MGRVGDVEIVPAEAGGSCRITVERFLPQVGFPNRWHPQCGYVVRQRFRETPVLAPYITAHISGLTIPEAAFYSGAWLSWLPDLLLLPCQPQREPRCAEQIARYVYGLMRDAHGPLQH